jgi:hypothetical protein
LRADVGKLFEVGVGTDHLMRSVREKAFSGRLPPLYRSPKEEPTRPLIAAVVELVASLISMYPFSYISYTLLLLMYLLLLFRFGMTSISAKCGIALYLINFGLDRDWTEFGAAKDI